MNKLWTAFPLCLVLAACSSYGSGVSPQEIVSGCNTVTAGEHTDPGLACFHAEGTLPTAVQFGDSVSKGYGIAARHDLCGVIDYRHDNWDTGDIDLCGEAYNPYDDNLVMKAANNNGYSGTLLDAIEKNLSNKHFNIVLFNSGYHDIQHPPSLVGTVRISESTYRFNLEAVAQICEQSADICIWVDTPGLDAQSLPLDNTVIDQDDVTRYNAIARSVAEEHGFYMLSMPNKDHDGTAHFTYQGYALAGEAIANCVLLAVRGARSAECHK